MRRREYSTHARADRSPPTIAAILSDAARCGPGGRRPLRAPLALQSWPGILHGGALIGLFDSAAASPDTPTRRVVEGRLTSSVPVETALELERRDGGGASRLVVLQGDQTLATGAVTPLDPDEVASAMTWAGGRDGWPVPTAEHCLACGIQNPLGLHAGLRADLDGLWVHLDPQAPWRTASGRLHSALAPVILDELAWWLGALVMKEGGLTNRIRVRLLEPDDAWEAPVVAAGRFDAVTAVDRRHAFWRTETALMAADGRMLATASIVFRGGPEYSARQIPYFRARTPPEIFERMFPSYVE